MKERKEIKGIKEINEQIMFLSFKYGWFDKIEALIQENIDLNARFQGARLLDLACERGNIQLLELLLKYQETKPLNINALIPGYPPALLRAIYKKNWHIVEILLEQDAIDLDLNIIYNGRTLLHHMLDKSDVDNEVTIDIIGKMLAKHADVNIRDIDGNTALHYAAQKGQIFIDLVMNAFVSIQNNSGKSAYVLAKDAGFHIDSLNKKEINEISVAIDEGTDFSFQQLFENLNIAANDFDTECFDSFDNLDLLLSITQKPETLNALQRSSILETRNTEQKIEQNIEVRYLTEIIYDNPMLNHRNYLDNHYINQAIDQERGIDRDQNKIETTKKLINFDQTNQYSSYKSINHLALASFTIKETIEAIPVIKYFAHNILHLPSYSLPEFIDNSYFKILTHYTACNIGAISISGDFNPMLSIVATALYSFKILSYEYLTQIRQEIFQNQNDLFSNKTSIDNPIEFIQKCGFDIMAQIALGSLNSIITARTPVLYDLAISASVGGMECYALYNQVEKATQAEKFTDQVYALKTIIPFVADTAIFYLMTARMQFDFTTQIGQMIAVKQAFTLMSSVVMTDYLSKLAISTMNVDIDIQEDYVTPTVNYLEQEINRIFENVCSSVVGETIEDIKFDL